MIEPLVSIITPTYNSEKFIEKIIISVLKQNYNNSEMIIVDDYSTDKSCEIVKSWTFKEERIKLISQNKN